MKKRILAFVLSLSLMLTVSVPSVMANPAESLPAAQQTGQQGSFAQDGNVETQANPWIAIYTVYKIIKWGLDIYESIQESQIEDATLNHFGIQRNPAWFEVPEQLELRDYYVPATGNFGAEYISLLNGDHDKFGWEHILGKHHPDWWTGVYTLNQDHSFFNPGTSFSEIEAAIGAIINENETNKLTVLEYGIDRHWWEDKATITGTYNNVEYLLVIKDGAVTTMYPTTINKVDEYNSGQP